MIHIDPQTQLSVHLTLYRRPDAPRFGEEERFLLDQVMPHLLAAEGANQIRALVALRETLDGPNTLALAVCDRQGTLHYAEHGFVERLLLEWPRWNGPHLPEAVGAAGYRGQHLQLDATEVGHLLLLSARPRTALAQLSAREADVAERFGGGSTRRSPATWAWRRTPCAITSAASTTSSASTARRASPTCCTTPPANPERSPAPPPSALKAGRGAFCLHLPSARGTLHMHSRHSPLLPQVVALAVALAATGARRRPQRPRLRLRTGGHGARRRLPAADPRQRLPRRGRQHRQGRPRGQRLRLAPADLHRHLRHPVHPQFIVPYVDVDIRAPGAASRSSERGLGDPQVGGTLFFINDPQSRTYSGLLTMLTVPVGEYHGATRTPPGANRWALHLNYNYTQGVGEKWMLEANLEAQLYGKNDDYFGQDLEQKPLYRLQAFASYDFTPAPTAPCA